MTTFPTFQTLKFNLFFIFLSTLLLLLGTISLTHAQAPPYVLGQAPNCMKTNSLGINTGFNYLSGTPYFDPEVDRYWLLTTTDGYGSNICPIVWPNWAPVGFPSIGVNAPYRSISVLAYTAAIVLQTTPIRLRVIC
ncbi:MAG: hypothetical protein R2831_04530 [Chitinophagaceae bacterium]